ncbi:MAG: DUF3467 domain-containing protein [bacterium]|nr:DUF3467 domain-containing protein [bacterium]
MSDKKQYKVKLREELEAGVYSNAVSVHVNNNEVILDMAYTMPNMPEPMIKIVSRVNMSHKTAESFLNVLSNAILDFKNKQKKKE